MRFFLTVTALLFSSASLEAQVAVVNGASFRADQPVTAGSWAAAFGNFSNVQQTVSPAFPLPKSLGGVSVAVDGVDAPLYFVSSSQLSFLIPAQTAPGLRPVEVKTPSGSIRGTARVMSAAPGLFIKDTTQQQPPKGAVRNQDGAENTSSSPARRGEVISIYATGPGALSAAVPDGAVAPRDPLVTTKSKPQVFVGGVAADVQFTGLAPDLPGVWQINAFVPNQKFISGRVAVQVFIDGVDSNEVSIFVAQ